MSKIRNQIEWVEGADRIRVPRWLRSSRKIFPREQEVLGYHRRNEGREEEADWIHRSKNRIGLFCNLRNLRRNARRLNSPQPILLKSLFRALRLLRPFVLNNSG